MTNEQITKVILYDDLVTLAQLTENHPRKEQPALSIKELKEQLLCMITKRHPEFWNILADYYYRLTQKVS